MNVSGTFVATVASASLSSSNGFINVADFGAVGDGTTDNTSAFKSAASAACAANAPLFVPPSSGKYLLSYIPPMDNLCVLGAGSRSSIIETTSASGDVFTLNGSYSSVKDIGFTSKVTRISGSYITMNSDGDIHDIFFENYYTGIVAKGNVSTFRTVHWGSNPASSESVGIYIEGYAGGIVLDDVHSLVPANGIVPLAGIKIVQCGAAIIANSDIIEQGTNLLIQPMSGQTVAAVYVINSYFDNATNQCVLINGLSGQNGNVVRVKFTSCWMSSAHNYHGCIISNSGSGTFSGFEFNDCTVVNNSDNGLIAIGSVQDVQVNGGLYAGNGSAGVSMAQNGGTGFQIIGVQAGAFGGVPGNKGPGIYVSGNSYTDYIISLCRTSGNSGSGISDNGNATNSKVVSNNT